MKTERITEDLGRCARFLQQGGLVAVPTETVYGLAGNGLDEAAVKRIYEVKGRPEVKALSLMVPDESAMDKYCIHVPPGAHTLAKSFWPGPLTIVLEARPSVPPIVRAGGSTVGLRCPAHEKTLQLLRLTGVPLAAPSANPSGQPSPKTAQEVLSYFDGKIEAVIDGGPCGIGRESTIVDMSAPPYKILRHGALTDEQVEDALCQGMTIVGVTGGTGCGKTTALGVLESMGAMVIDCDEVYHRLTAESEPLRQALISAFGSVYSDGVLDRKRLGSIVFSDPESLAKLNAITHKYVDMELRRLLRQHAMNGGRLAAIDAIALLENDFASLTAFNVAVTAPKKTRVERLMQREGISEQYALLRIEAQPDETYFTQKCDYTLRNDGSMTEFKDKCEKFFMEELKNGK